MHRGDPGPDVLDRYAKLQDELSDLVAYIQDTKRTLGLLQDDLPAASDALSSVTETTERATHNILGLIERVMEEDESQPALLASVAEAAAKSGDKSHERAARALQSAYDARVGVLTEVMTELSFQDLTSQALDRIASRFLEIERRILPLVDPSVRVKTPALAPVAAHSGIARLRETQAGASLQCDIDELIRGLG